MPSRLLATTVDIAAAPAAVWAVMSDIERWAEWTPSITSVTRTSHGPLGIGSTALVKQPKLAPANFAVTTWQAERGFDWVTKNPLVTALGRHTIEQTTAGCRVTLSVEFSGWLAGVIGRLYGDLTNRYIRMEAAGLKNRVESRMA